MRADLEAATPTPSWWRSSTLLKVRIEKIKWEKETFDRRKATFVSHHWRSLLRGGGWLLSVSAILISSSWKPPDEAKHCEVKLRRLWVRPIENVDTRSRLVISDVRGAEPKKYIDKAQWYLIGQSLYCSYGTSTQPTRAFIFILNLFWTETQFICSISFLILWC